MIGHILSLFTLAALTVSAVSDKTCFRALTSADTEVTCHRNNLDQDLSRTRLTCCGPTETKLGRKTTLRSATTAHTLLPSQSRSYTTPTLRTPNHAPGIDPGDARPNSEYPTVIRRKLSCPADSVRTRSCCAVSIVSSCLDPIKCSQLTVTPTTKTSDSKTMAVENANSTQDGRRSPAEPPFFVNAGTDMLK